LDAACVKNERFKARIIVGNCILVTDIYVEGC
jgi:hypothetical protein